MIHSWAIIIKGGHQFGSRCFHTYKRDLLLQNCSTVQIWSDQSHITFFLTKGSPLWMLNFFFIKSIFYQSHVIALGLTIPKWYNTWVLKIFLEIFFSKIWKNILKIIFWKNISKKYFQYFKFGDFEKKNIFQNPLYFEKSNLALVGPNLHSRTILQKQIDLFYMSEST